MGGAAGASSVGKRLFGSNADLILFAERALGSERFAENGAVRSFDLSRRGNQLSAATEGTSERENFAGEKGSEWESVGESGRTCSEAECSDCKDVAIKIGPDARAMMASGSFAASARDCSTVAAWVCCAGGNASLTMTGAAKCSRKCAMDSRRRAAIAASAVGIVENVHVAGLGLLGDFGEFAFVAGEQIVVAGKFRKQIPVIAVEFGNRRGVRSCVRQRGALLGHLKRPESGVLTESG